MRRRHVNRFLALVLVPPAAMGTGAQDEALRQLTPQWRRLRALKGHFDGAPWNAEVDRFGGAKHATLARLGQWLASSGATRTEVEATLGRPDEMVRKGAALHERTRQRLTAAGAPGVTFEPTADAASADLWLYRWRGRHDQLVVLMRAGRVVGCGWLFDWE